MLVVGAIDCALTILYFDFVKYEKEDFLVLSLVEALNTMLEDITKLFLRRRRRNNKTIEKGRSKENIKIKESQLSD